MELTNQKSMALSGLKQAMEGESSFTTIKSFSTDEPRRDRLHVLRSFIRENAVSHLTLVDGIVNIRSITNIISVRLSFSRNTTSHVTLSRSYLKHKVTCRYSTKLCKNYLFLITVKFIMLYF